MNPHECSLVDIAPKDSEPLPVTFYLVDMKGQQLCSFCPVFRKTPVKVDVILNPGLVEEMVKIVCPDVSQTVPETFWITGWTGLRGDLLGYIPDWDLINTPQLLAQKTLTGSKTVVGVAYTEKTDLKMKPCTMPPSGDRCTAAGGN